MRSRCNLFELVGGERVCDRLLKNRDVDDDCVLKVVAADDLISKPHERARCHDDLVAALDAEIAQDFLRLREDFELAQGVQPANQRVFLVRFAKKLNMYEFLCAFLCDVRS